ncbi:MAG TPA: DUF763 domain-containing protein [Dehalococcoidia bacterium]|nr:DUF763 domain-containing protein [Dehalococcoidia bacterium]
MISELVYGVTPSYHDPARYSFTHGGKDGIPYPIDRKTYDQSIEFLSKAIHKTKLGIREKKEVFNRLYRLRSYGQAFIEDPFSAFNFIEISKLNIFMFL